MTYFIVQVQFEVLATLPLYCLISGRSVKHIPFSTLEGQVMSFLMIFMRQSLNVICQNHTMTGPV